MRKGVWWTPTTEEVVEPSGTAEEQAHTEERYWRWDICGPQQQRRDNSLNPCRLQPNPHHDTWPPLPLPSDNQIRREYWSIPCSHSNSRSCFLSTNQVQARRYYARLNDDIKKYDERMVMKGWACMSAWIQKVMMITSNDRAIECIIVWDWNLQYFKCTYYVAVSQYVFF